MVVEAGSRRDNIEKSVNAYLNTNLAGTLGLTVYYHGQGRIGTLPVYWVEADLIAGNAIDTIKQSGSDQSIAIECFLNLNLFERGEDGTRVTNIYQMATLSEQIKAFFLINMAIPVLDYNDIGLPSAGALMIWERLSMREIETAPDLAVKQLNISVPLRYHEILLGA